MSLDIHVQLLDPSLQRRRALFTFGFEQPIFVSGAQKLLDRWLKVFMTPKGSHSWRRAEGTEFVSLLTSGVSNLDELQVDILDCIEDATEQVKAQDQRAVGRFASERLLTAKLLRFVETGPTSAEFWVEVQNTAGVRVTTLIPYAQQ